ncbi:unnamed protein product [Euphydryas editha]|nr:unnamed protein product [Euphydryas editha]
MRSAETRYPVDRYLVESSKKFDMVNIIDDDIWNSEPALRPEDEIVLRKLHDMLQSTADDLKLLSGELSKYHESDVQKKISPTPLDEDFNEKVHIEEVVNARFHGHKPIGTESTPRRIRKDLVDGIVQSIVSKCNNKQFVNHGVQVNQPSILKKSSTKNNLGVSRTNVIQISKPSENKVVINNNEKSKKNNNSVTYNEFSYKYVEPKPTFVKKPLQIQTMPSINIRSELKEQKVLQLDIHPKSEEVHEKETAKSNALVIEMKHEDSPKPAATKPITFDRISYIPHISPEKPLRRKISKMSAYESESTNNVSSESQDSLKKKIKTAITLRTLQRTSHAATQKTKKNVVNKKEVKRESKGSLDEWHKKLNAVYGGTSKLKNSGVKKTKVSPKTLGKEKATSSKKTTSQVLNNIEYIPYSKLTIGGVNVSDVEKEISNIPNKGEIVLSPILDKILSSRENSFHNNSPRKTHKNKILTTSDEDLLQEVLDIEKEITRSTSTKNENNINELKDKDQINKESNIKDGDSYDDDFEDENSNDSERGNQSQVSNADSSVSIPPNNSIKDDAYDLNENHKNEKDNVNIHNKTYTKMSNLSFKNTVDIFEFIHSVDTQDTATQSNTSNKATRQENQTSSSDDKSNVQPIHNDLWPSIDPRGEVEKMFKLEKEFIKKLIIDEYGDLLEKQLNKPSTSKNIDNSSERNVSSSQKNTQTSPAHVKSVMTSPTRTKTRTTSPFPLSLSINQQTSPIVAISKEEELKVEIENDEDLNISVNLSSPRFSLRLPQTTREVLSNIKSEYSYNIENAKADVLRRNVVSSSSSGEGDYSSSDISSLGQIDKIYKKRLRRSRIPSISEISSSSSTLSRYSSNRFSVLHLKSEGEASIGKIINKISNKHSKSEGEMSLGQLN